MEAEILAIGDELTSGQRIDTNSAWLSQQLADVGVRVLFHTTVADDLNSIIEVVQRALERVDVVIGTGGLGPTADDLTRQAVARALGTELRLDEAALQHIASLFARRDRPMPEQNRIQAMFPVGSQIIPNPHGTAPGIDMHFGRSGGRRSRLFALPGVPAEMRQMWDQTVAPALREMGAGNRIIRHHRIKCFGVGESDLEQMLPDLIRRGQSPSVGITVHKATITLRITAEGATDEDCRQLMRPTIATIHECLGDLVFGEEDDELQHVIGKTLIGRGETVSTVELATHGTMANWLYQLPSSGEFLGWGLTLQSLDAAYRLLDKEQRTEASRGEKQLTSTLARSIRERTGTTYAVAIGPVTEPRIERDGIQRVPMAIAAPNGVRVVMRAFGGHPDILIERAAKQGLDLLRQHLRRASAG